VFGKGPVNDFSDVFLNKSVDLIPLVIQNPVDAEIQISGIKLEQFPQYILKSGFIICHVLPHSNSWFGLDDYMAQTQSYFHPVDRPIQFSFKAKICTACLMCIAWSMRVFIGFSQVRYPRGRIPAIGLCPVLPGYEASLLSALAPVAMAWHGRFPSG
jgi:hypothetical protein